MMPDHKVAEEYRQLAREVLERLKAPVIERSNDEGAVGGSELTGATAEPKPAAEAKANG